MILRGIDFGSVHQMSGATNFDFKGWWYHRFTKPFGGSFSGSTPVAKTTTLLPRAGNMPLKKDGMTPKELLPKCIYVNRRTKAAVNAVSLSGPGLGALLQASIWENVRTPFVISLMSLAAT